ncbi:hypothetical protein M569_05483, partial [Genlisea aurea]
PKLETQIDVKSSSLHLFQPRASTELTAEELLKEKRIPFPLFRRLSQRKESSWIISLFVILHLIAFAATMAVNDCWTNSHARCFFARLGRFSFQPLSENPFLGPSASALDDVGALRLRYLEKHDHNPQIWRLFASPFLHAGVFHLLLSLSFVILIGIHLEQEFGPLKIGAIYVVSALTGNLLAVQFLHDRPSVSSSGALFGLLGAMLSGLAQNYKVYTRKLATLIAFVVIVIINAAVGLMPLVDNFSSIGGFLSGVLVGFALRLKPRIEKLHRNKAGIFEYDDEDRNGNRSRMLICRMDFGRCVSLVVFALLAAGGIVATFHGIDLNEYCGWCQYLDCVPSKWWSCSHETMACETMISSYQLTLTCSGNGRFEVFPSSDYSKGRIEDLCNLLCS